MAGPTKFRGYGGRRGMAGSFKSEARRFGKSLSGLGNFSKDVSGMMSDLGGNVFGGLLNKFKGFNGGSVFKQFSSSGVNVSNMASLLSKSSRELNLDLASGASTVMKNDPFAFTSVMYPRDLTVDTSLGHYIQFYINVQNVTKYNFRTPTGGFVGGGNTTTEEQDVYTTTYTGDPASREGITSSSETVKTGTQHVDVTTGSSGLYGADIYQHGGGLGESTITSGPRNSYVDQSDQAQLFMNKRKRKYGLTSVYQPTTRIAHSCSIYLPSIQDNTSMSYNTVETGLLGYLAAAGFKGYEALTAKQWDRLARIGLGTFKGALTEAAKQLGMGIAEGFTSAEGGYELLNKVYGRAQNPYMEVLFNAPELRQFTYNFTFAPRNKKETEDVQNIIKLFRFHMSPELRQDHNMFLTLPSEFDIYYMYLDGNGTAAENKYVNKISTCVLTNCTVDYTPGGVKMHHDGSPVVIKMGLTFQEMDMITKDHVAEGF